jgi:hypothetical protein
MIRHLPIFLLGLGFLLGVVGFLYDVSFAGIPFQDPTPEMQARYAHHSRIAAIIGSAAGVAFLLGAIAFVIQVVAQRIRKGSAAKTD